VPKKKIIRHPGGRVPFTGSNRGQKGGKKKQEEKLGKSMYRGFPKVRNEGEPGGDLSSGRFLAVLNRE